MDNPVIEKLKQDISAVEDVIEKCNVSIAVSKNNIGKMGRLANKLQDLIEYDKESACSSLASWTSSLFYDSVVSWRSNLYKEQNFWKLKLNSYRKDLRDTQLKGRKFDDYLKLIEEEEGKANVGND